MTVRATAAAHVRWTGYRRWTDRPLSSCSEQMMWKRAGGEVMLWSKSEWCTQLTSAYLIGYETTLHQPHVNQTQTPRIFEN